MKETCLFTPLDEKRARAVQKLQEMCRSPSDANFIQALEHNKIPGVDFTKKGCQNSQRSSWILKVYSKRKDETPKEGCSND